MHIADDDINRDENPGNVLFDENPRIRIIVVIS